LLIRRGQVHRTHGQVISIRAEDDRAALMPLPEQPYLVTEKHLRRVGKDWLVSFEASCYSVPARQIRAGQRVQLQVDVQIVTIRALGAQGGHGLSTHSRATTRGSWVVDPAHWDGLPDGHTRATTLDSLDPVEPIPLPASGGLEPLSLMLARRHANITVASRPLTDYARAAAGAARSELKENQ